MQLSLISIFLNKYGHERLEVIKKNAKGPGFRKVCRGMHFSSSLKCNTSIAGRTAIIISIPQALVRDKRRLLRPKKGKGKQSKSSDNADWREVGSLQGQTRVPQGHGCGTRGFSLTNTEGNCTLGFSSQQSSCTKMVVFLGVKRCQMFFLSSFFYLSVEKGEYCINERQQSLV